MIKRLLLTMCLAFVALVVNAQVFNQAVTPGTLDAALGTTKLDTKEMTLTGSIDYRDLMTISEMTWLVKLNLNGVSIVAYTDGTTIHPADEIPNELFESSTISYSLTDVKLPSDLKRIGFYAFASCRQLASITFPNTLVSIDKYAFAHCEGLISVTLPESLVDLGESAFENCILLSSINLPTTMKILQPGVFYNCTSLQTINLPNGLEKIDIDVFSGSGLSSITLPNTLTTIGNKAFGYTKLTSIVLPNSLTTIGSTVFSNCSLLEEVVIPSSITSFGGYIFDEVSLKKLICRSETPLLVIFNTFASMFNLSNVTLYVPSQTAVDAYKADANWNIFGTITVGFPTSTSSIDEDQLEVLSSNGYVYVKSSTALPSVELLSTSGQLISKYSNQQILDIDLKNNAIAILKVILPSGKMKVVKVFSSKM